MILRRLARNLKQQNWTAIWIEFILLVAGVFLGIQVSNWNEQRETNQKAAVFTERLKADLRKEDWGYLLMVDYNRQVLANANRVVDALEGKADMPDEALLVSAYRATQYKQRVRRRSTYDELTSTGTIGLIRDARLRDTAIRLYNIVTLEVTAREGLESHYREAFRMTVPNEVQRTLARQCGDHIILPGNYAAIPGVLDYPCRTGLSDQAIADAAAALRANPELLPYLRLRVADLETRIADLTSNNRDIVENLRAIVKEAP